MSGIKLGKKYESFLSVSSLLYYDKALLMQKNLSDTSLYLTARIGRAKSLGVSGFYLESIEELHEIEQYGIPKDIELLFYDCARQSYAYMMGYTTSNNEYTTQYFVKNRYSRDR